MSDQSPAVGVSAPTLRIRIAHAHTIKDGWRLAETTVEWTGQASEPSAADLTYAMKLAHELGQEETKRRQHAGFVGGQD